MFSLFRLVFIASRYTHTLAYIRVVVVTVCIRHLPFCGQCVLLLLLLLFAYAYLPLNDAAGVVDVVVVAALYFALPPPLPSAAASVFDSTFAFAPSSTIAFCLHLAPFAVSISLAIPVPILYPRASLRILVELLLKVQHWQRAWA